MEIPAPTAKAPAICVWPITRKMTTPRPARDPIQRGSLVSAPSRVVGFAITLCIFFGPGQNLEEFDDPSSRTGQASYDNESRRRVQVVIEKPAQQDASYHCTWNDETQARIKGDLRPDASGTRLLRERHPHALNQRTIRSPSRCREQRPQRFIKVLRL